MLPDALFGSLQVLRVGVVFAARAIAGFFELNEFGFDLGAGYGGVVLRKGESGSGQCRGENESGDKEFVHDDLKNKVSDAIYLARLNGYCSSVFLRAEKGCAEADGSDALVTGWRR